MGEDESQENSQTEAVADETSRQHERSQTPQFGGVGESDTDDDKEEDRCIQPTVNETVFQLNCFPKNVSSPENVALTIFLS